MADVKKIDGTKAGTVTLADELFNIEPNVPLMHQVVTAQLNAARAGTQSTKTRSEVRGGGAKPFKQKGTGRARQGTSRAPHMEGGGVALGPKPRSYRQKVNKKMVQASLASALSDRNKTGKVVVLDDWSISDTPSTKSAIKTLDALGLDGKILMVMGRGDETAYLSFRNLPNTQVILSGELNTYDVLCNDWVVFSKETLPTNATGDDVPAKRAGAPESFSSEVSE